MSKYFLRNIIGNCMTELGRENSKVAVVTADLMGTCRVREFFQEFPGRSFNVGIAEQNMVSFAAGLAHEGFLPYVFTMAPFLSMRACEQCRTDVAYGHLNVRLMGTYAGVSGGISGATHWSMEDVAIMCGIPGMTVLEPCDPVEAQKLMAASLDFDGPLYIRSTIEPVDAIYDESYPYQIGKASIAREGQDGTFICAGITVKYACQASESIEQKYGKRVRVVDMHTIKPIDRDAAYEAAETGFVVAAQDHNVFGGLGTQVAQVLAEAGKTCRFKIAGIPDKFTAMAHSAYLYHQFGYDAEGLEALMMSLMKD